MNSRLKKLISSFAENHIDALLITKDVNIKYLTHFPSSESWLLVCPTKVIYITDFRYTLEAQKGLKGQGIDVKQTRSSLYETLFELSTSLKIHRIGFDERHLSLAQYKVLTKHCPRSAKLVSVNNLVEKFREIKDENEIQFIKKALKIHGEAIWLLKQFVKPGLTEQEVLYKLEDFIRSKNVGFSFSPIVASGVNSCFPHAKVTARKIRNNELVLIDMGIDFQGYKSDLTRMFFFGKITPLVKEVNDLVKESQRRAIEMIAPGVKVSQVDKAARNFLAKKGLAKYFGHALGHGVGLEIHENPRLSQKDPAILQTGMVITVEPAVYIPNKFGIRIEDMVLVTDKKCEVLSGRYY